MQLEHSNTLGEYYLKAYFTKPLLTINRKNLNKTGDQFECQKQVRLRHTRLKQQKIDHKPELCYEEKFEKCPFFVHMGEGGLVHIDLSVLGQNPKTQN